MTLLEIPACGIVERKSLEWKISKIFTNLVRHRDFADRDTDGVHRSSLCSKLRREFESEGARFSDSQWLDIHEGSNPDFNIALEQQPLYVRAQGDSGELLLN